MCGTGTKIIGDILEQDQIFKTETGIYFLEEPDPKANS
jgi:hypothetical protein